MKFLKITFILLSILFIDKAVLAQSFLEADTVSIVYIQPKKNPFSTRPTFFYIRKQKLPFYLNYIKPNYWKTTAAFGLNLNQSTFSDNWSSGGVNSIALSSQINYKSEYNKDGKNFITELVLQYGKIKNKDQMQKKTNDRIFWDNKAAIQLSKSWYFFGSVSFESQFDTGFKYEKDKETGEEIARPISKFMSPGYLTESLGFEYKPEKWFSLRLGTGTARQTFMLDTSLYKFNEKNFGVQKGKTFRNELAFQAVANLDKDVMENINLKARYFVFAAYETLNNMDQRLDVTVTAKVNKVINVTVNGTALYDDDASTEIQAAQSLALGLVYKLPK